VKKWCAHEAFKKAIHNHRSPALPSSTARLYQDGEPIPIEVWEDALIKAASFVDRWGEAYLPLFERVEWELEKARQQIISLEKARSIARGNLSSDYIKTLSQQSYLIEP